MATFAERLDRFWHWLTTSRYTRQLEAEVLRLRAENKAMLDSMMGIMGMPPLRLQQEMGEVPTSVRPRPAAAGKQKAGETGPHRPSRWPLLKLWLEARDRELMRQEQQKRPTAAPMGVLQPIRPAGIFAEAAAAGPEQKIITDEEFLA